MTSGFHWVRLTIIACDPVFPHVPICGTEGVLFPLSAQKIKNKNAWSKVIWEWPSFDSECTKLWNISVGFSWPSPISFLFTVISRQCYECLSLRSFKDCDAHRISGIVRPKRVAKRKFTQHLVACTLKDALRPAHHQPFHTARNLESSVKWVVATLTTAMDPQVLWWMEFLSLPSSLLPSWSYSDLSEWNASRAIPSTIRTDHNMHQIVLSIS